METETKVVSLRERKLRKATLVKDVFETLKSFGLNVKSKDGMYAIYRGKDFVRNVTNVKALVDTARYCKAFAEGGTRYDYNN